MSYDKGVIESFRARLLNMRVEIMARLQRNSQPIFAEELNGFERQDKPQVIQKHENEKEKATQDLKDVESALQKCQDGTYGRCGVCGESIPLARLEAIPTARRCVSCQAAKMAKKK